MKVLKYIAMALLGFALYEGYRMLYKRFHASSGGSSARGNLHKALNADQGRMSTLTGTGRGSVVKTENSDGGSSPTIVGRGVVHRG